MTGFEERLAIYKGLVIRWNRRIPLISRRSPEESLARLIRHSLAGARRLPTGIVTLIDIGSGAGLPGIPVALARQNINVRLFERSSKKQLFLREVLRTLDIENAVLCPEEFRPQGLDAARPLAVTAIGIGRYRDMALRVRPWMQPQDGLLLFVAEGLAAEIAADVDSQSWSWEKLVGSDRTGTAWIET